MRGKPPALFIPRLIAGVVLAAGIVGAQTIKLPGHGELTLRVPAGGGYRLTELSEAVVRAAKEQGGRLEPVGLTRTMPAKVGWFCEMAAGENRPVWRNAIASTGASAMRVEVDGFSVGAGELWFHGANSGSKAIFGPYQREGPFGNRRLLSGIIDGETAWVAYYPANESSCGGAPPFEISSITHLWIGTSGLRPVEMPGGVGRSALACNLDISCYSEWKQYGSPVARIVFQKNGSSYACSGTLLMSRDLGGQSYFLTANHCIGTDPVAQTVAAVWNYETSTCNGPVPDPGSLPGQNNGANLIATGAIGVGDYALIKFVSNAPSTILPAYWSGAAVGMGDNVTGIHHPGGEYKRISFGFRGADEAVIVDGQYAPADAFYQVFWNSGVIERGSSGSPLFWMNPAKNRYEVAGVLSYGVVDGSVDLCVDRSTSAGYGRVSGFAASLLSAMGDVPACTYGLSQSVFSVTAAGTTGTFNLTTACPWTAISSSPWWLTVTSAATGSGNAAITFSVAANSSGAARSANISIGGTTVVVNQAASGSAPAGTITTFAGTGAGGYTGDGGPAVSARLSDAADVAADSLGNVFIADSGPSSGGNNVIRKVDNGGTITTHAGNGVGYSGDGGPAASARFNHPYGIDVNPATGGLLLADTYNNRVRGISAGSTVSTLAGSNSVGGFGGDSGPALSARLNQPQGVVADGAGNLYIADTNNNRIRKVNTLGVISTVAGTGSCTGLVGDGGLAVNAEICAPVYAAPDGAGGFYISDFGQNRVRYVTPGGVIGTFAGTGSGSSSGDGGAASSAGVAGPAGIALDTWGNLFIAETGGHRVRMVTPGGVISTIAGTGVAGSAGDGGPAASAQLTAPASVKVDSAGNLYVAEQGALRVRKITALQTPRTVYFTPFSAAISPGGGSGTISVTTATPAVQWSVTSGVGWITVNSPPGTVTGSGTVRYTVAANSSGAARSGQLTIAGQAFTVTQGAIVFVVSPGSASYPAAGGTGSVSVTPDYASGVWSATSNAAWISVTAPVGAVTGAGTVNYTVAASPVNTIRTGTMTIAGQTFTVTQAARTAELGVVVSHSGSLYQGQSGGAFGVTVSNAAGAGATVGTVTATATLSSGLALVSMAGSGWQCSQLVCTRTDVLAGGASYPQILVTVNVAQGAASPQTVSVTASGGGSAAGSASDAAVVEAVYSISGSVGLSGVTVALSGSASGSTTSDSGGGYAFGNLRASGSYTLTPSRAGFSFSPVSTTVGPLTGNQTVNFTPLVSTTVATSPAGLQVSVDGTAYAAPQVFQWVVGSQHTVSAVSPQDAAGVRRLFDTWSDGGAQAHTVTVPAAASTVTASFKTQYLLTTTASPAAGGSISPASGYVNAGAQVQVNASANAGYQFSGFSGDLSGATTPQPVTMDGPKTVTANFSALTGVTVATNPAGLQVSVDGTTYTAPQVFQWVAGSQHTIGVSSPQDGSGVRRVFGSWSDGGAQTHTVTAPAAATTYTAAFSTQYLLTTAASPAAGGSISPASGYVNAGTQVQVSAAANAGYAFTGFSGDLSGGTSPQQLTMNGPKSVTANFSALTGVTVATNPAGLQVSVDGTNYTTPQVFQWIPGSQHTIGVSSPQDGSGVRRVFGSWSDGGAQTHTVTAPAAATTYTAAFSTQYLLTTAASPAAGGSISPASGYVDAGTQVQVSAAANAGYGFTGFSGDLSGSATPQMLTMSGPKSVSANFAALPTTFTISGNVGLGGVSIALSGGASGSTTSDAGGAYSFPGLAAGGSYVVTPSKAGYAFSPVSQSVAALTANVVLNWLAPTPIPVTARLSLSALNFGANLPTTAATPAQEIVVSMSGGSAAWTAAPDQSWLKVTSGSGTGSGTFRVSADAALVAGVGKYTGKVNFNVPSAGISAAVNCTFTVMQSTTAPVGSFDTPIDNANLVSSFAVTGWALDDVGVANVKIYRDSVAPEPAGVQVYVGDAVFVPGTRPDVEAAFPGMPQASRAGWGYMLLSYFLPGGGNGIYKLYAIATDLEGRKTTLGSKTIRVDNAHAAKPFGAIDTPGQGETVGGAAYVNFGWALTPQTGKIPVDGSTMQVYLDGAPVGTVDYNHPRGDVDGLFPGYANTGGAVGFKYLDTTQLANGLHNIAWSVTDNLGRTDGVGSRFFWVLNGGGGASGSGLVSSQSPRRQGKAAYRTGYAAGAPFEELREIVVEELERIEVALPAAPGGALWSGAVRFGAESRPLPVGSSFDAEAGVFRWQLGPGFLGRHELVFTAGDMVVPVVVRIATERRRGSDEGSGGRVR